MNRVRRPRIRAYCAVMLSYDVAGTGPALVLLHSTVCDRRMWDTQWPVLVDAGYRVVRCDFRGYGETPVPQGPHDDAADVLDLAGVASASSGVSGRHSASLNPVETEGHKFW